MTTKLESDLRIAGHTEARIATLMRADAAAKKLCGDADYVDMWIDELNNRAANARTKKAKIRLLALRDRLDAQWPSY